MDIQKKDNYSFVQRISLAVSMFLSLTTASLADSASAAKAIDNAYKLGHCVEPNAIGKVVSDLQIALKDCSDSNLSSRMRYELGMLYFKASMPDQAKEQFLKSVGANDSPLLIHICSLNMIGQISRMAGQGNDAIGTFGQLVQAAEKISIDDKRQKTVPGVLKLMCGALFARAEIFEDQKNYAAAVSEYRHIITVLDKTDGGLRTQYVPLAKDRMSQLCLMEDKVEEYFKAAASIVEQQPEYYRAPLIQFEIEAIKCLKGVKADSKFPEGSFTSPAKLVTYLKDTKDNAVFKVISDKLDSLCKNRENTYAGILLKYHYAWLLDAMDERDKAVKLFSLIISADDPNKNVSPQMKTVIKTVADYARVQCAIMYGESGDYSQSLKVLSGLQVGDNKDHLSNLTQSVENSIETLKREVPRNDDKE